MENGGNRVESVVLGPEGIGKLVVVLKEVPNGGRVLCEEEEGETVGGESVVKEV